jgi:hypothetical protein
MNKTSNHGLRTTGTHTGNFGYAKVKGKPGELDLTKEILSKDNLRIPPRDEAFTRLVEAYNKSSDPRLKATLWDMLKQRKATLQPIVVKHEAPTSEYWEMVRRVR